MIKKIFFTTILLMYLFTIVGCQDQGTEPIINEQLDEQMVKANQEFAFDIFKALQREDRGKDIFISPLSISTALSMTLKGAKDETKQEMENVLNVDNIREDILSEYYQSMLQVLNDYQGDIDLSIQNSIWVKQGEKIEQEFIEEMESIFNAPIEELDFSKEDSVDKINDWIADATNEKIKDMLKPPIPPNAIMYLINAIYFNANWQYEFDPEETFEADFTTESSKVVKVDMMNQKMDTPYFKNDSFQAIKLPYVNENLSMMMFLPNSDTSINEFIINFDSDIFLTAINNFSEYEELIVQIPKFKIEYGTKLLNDSLKSLGMEIPFSSQADFSKIREGLMISKVLHKSFIEVNEEGSEAAAATIVELVETVALEPEIFRADRPFIFMIYDSETESILFMGKHS